MLKNPTLAAIAREQESAESALDIVCLDDVKAVPIEWLWEFRFAVGKVSALAGDGGQGKSTILCDIAARVTREETFPDGAPASPPGNVIFLTSEDGVEDTLKPRLLAVDADMKRVSAIRSVRDRGARRGFNLQADLARLEDEIQRRGNVRLVIIDPISSYLGKGVDSHKNAEVRSVLEPVGEMAQRLKVAVICNNHFSKGNGNANSRFIGSVAFVNQARSAYIVTPDAENEDRYLFMPSKANNAPKRDGLAYRIEGCLVHDDGEEILTSRIAWESTPVTISANEALAAHTADNESRTAKQEGMDFLQRELAGGARKPAQEVRRQASAAGITPKALRSAREALGIKPEKDGFDGGWVWALPKMPNTPEGAHFQRRASSAPEGIFEGEVDAPALGPAGDRLSGFDGGDLDIPEFLKRS